ncbi:unnamed protein product [Lymnaea stagnalis]|uniref:Uncharacterized protein n=1 Tax=Lymnaea stagnalis TaxID=6523 RepID=A0AAV2HZ23_LYMST
MRPAMNKGPDRDLARKKCGKRNQHNQFFKLRTFSHELLPNPYKKNKNFDKLVQALGKLVVKIELTKKSRDRPREVYSNARGSFNSSGQIIFSKLMRSTRSRHCPCSDCKNTSKRRREKEYAIISIKTAAHAIFNEEEVKNATCTLNFDVIGARDLKLKGYKLDEERTSMEFDTSTFYCITHDLELAKSLIGTIYQLKRSHEKVFKRYPKKQDKNFVIVVSHPHGCVKHVSFGRLKSKSSVKDLDGRRTLIRLSYDAITCPASSGAPIYTISQRKIWYLPSHSSYVTRAEGNISESNVVWESMQD